MRLSANSYEFDFMCVKGRSNTSRRKEAYASIPGGLDGIDSWW